MIGAKDENPEFLRTQIITCIGNKRALLPQIEEEIFRAKEALGKARIVCADLFSGSGVVARMMKRHSSRLVANDQENYSFVVNSCYLSNKGDFPREKYLALREKIVALAETEKIEGIIAKNYAPRNDEKIEKSERVFYTRENALLIDTYRALIEKFAGGDLKKYFLAPLVTEASIHANTSGVFKGFYKDKNTGAGCFGGAGKNALPRILGRIELKEPALSDFSSEIELRKEDAIALSRELKNIDVAYLDPPYNQHPYGSNYFMLNLIIKNSLTSPVSRVSGIPRDWNRSPFNKASRALESLEKIVESIDAKFIVLSYNSEGFVKREEMTEMLKKHGALRSVEIDYNAFRGSRNLSGRNARVTEYLFTLEKTR